jgi:asparagine N-glycosylation enzyme membrane subunit Stt3
LSFKLKELLLEKTVKINKHQAIILVLIFFLAFGVRAHLMKYELMFGFDSYFHARIVGYVIENGFPPERDPLAYPQIGGSPVGNLNVVFWQLTALIYKIFTLGSAYNKQTWIFFVKVLPALFGH